MYIYILDNSTTYDKAVLTRGLVRAAVHGSLVKYRRKLQYREKTCGG